MDQNQNTDPPTVPDGPAELPRPRWVKAALWGLPNRTAAWLCFWFSIAIAFGCVAYSFIDRRFFCGILIFFAAWWYYGAIRWVDRNDRWR